MDTGYICSVTTAHVPTGNPTQVRQQQYRNGVSTGKERTGFVKLTPSKGTKPWNQHKVVHVDSVTQPNTWSAW